MVLIKRLKGRSPEAVLYVNHSANRTWYFPELYMGEYPVHYSSAVDFSSVELYWDVPGDPLYQRADAAIVKLAGLRSRHNTYMSVPLVWAMIGQHTTYFAGGNLGIPSDYFWIFLLIIIIVGWHIVFQIYKKAGKVPGF